MDTLTTTFRSTLRWISLGLGTWILCGVFLTTARAGELRFQPVPQFRPPTGHHLPVFGFASYNIAGFGDRVTSVRYGSTAWRWGLERGDTILSAGHVRLAYHGAWERALRQALLRGDTAILLTVRDGRTGRTVHRYIDLPNRTGPITPKFRTGR